MNVSEIPTNVPVARIDDDDEFYKHSRRQERSDHAKLIRECREAASRCWSAPPPSKNRNCCPNS
jgi:preprotein translocase subunit SecA